MYQSYPSWFMVTYWASQWRAFPGLSGDASTVKDVRDSKRCLDHLQMVFVANLSIKQKSTYIVTLNKYLSFFVVGIKEQVRKISLSHVKIPKSSHHQLCSFPHYLVYNPIHSSV